MHIEAYNGLKKMIDESGIQFEKNHRILDIGGRDINGSVRDLIPQARWTGLDIVDGPGVDIVRDATRDWMSVYKPVPEHGEFFDVVIMTEVFEHVEDWRGIIRTCAQALSSVGEESIFMTCASTGRRPHGASGELDPPPGEWYRNVEQDELERQLSKFFNHYAVTYNPHPGDLYAWAQCVKSY